MPFEHYILKHGTLANLRAYIVKIGTFT